MSKNIFIYNPNSHGGNFQYAQYTANALTECGNSVNLVIPKAPIENEDFSTVQILMSDTPKTQFVVLRKIYFLLRSFFNPLFFLAFLIGKPKSSIIFNDFDQLTAIFWVPLFRLFLGRHTFGIIMHDPDRDKYPGGIAYSQLSMHALLSLMQVVFYHEQLPDKPYYQKFRGQFCAIPHGIYPPANSDIDLNNQIQQFKDGYSLLCIPGNIRLEKNYELIISSLQELPQCKLLIAGAAANSSISIASLKQHAIDQGVENRVLWVARYLTENEFSSVLLMSDLVLLYYKKSFTSQSGILNQIAPLKSNVLISETSSALTKLAKQFSLGTIARADDKNAFVASVNKALIDTEYDKPWDDYILYASWSEQAKRIVSSF